MYRLGQQCIFKQHLQTAVSDVETTRYDGEEFTVADVASDAPEFVQPLTDNITTPHGGSATFYCRVRSYGAPHIQVCIETAKAVHSSVVVLLYFFANDFLRRR